MYLIYVDESGDVKRSVGNTKNFIISALFVKSDEWNNVFHKIKEFREDIKKNFGIFMRKELHATDFISGRGNIGNRIVTKFERCTIFKNTLEFISNLESISIINVCIENNHPDVLELSYNRLLNRISRALDDYNDSGILIIDVGKETQILKIFRKMRIYNPIPSQFGSWEDGNKIKNKPILQIIEDPFFKSSESSYFLQLIDFVAFSCLRREEPTQKILKYNLEKSFEVLKPVLNLNASRSDPFGVVRK